jgi:hypothetical protein
MWEKINKEQSVQVSDTTVPPQRTNARNKKKKKND